MHRLMGVAADYHIYVLFPGIFYRPVGKAPGKFVVEAFKPACQAPALNSYHFQKPHKIQEKTIYERLAENKAPFVKLVAVHGAEFFAIHFPMVFFNHVDANNSIHQAFFHRIVVPVNAFYLFPIGAQILNYLKMLIVQNPSVLE